MAQQYFNAFKDGVSPVFLVRNWWIGEDDLGPKYRPSDLRSIYLWSHGEQVRLMAPPEADAVFIRDVLYEPSGRYAVDGAPIWTCATEPLALKPM